MAEKSRILVSCVGTSDPVRGYRDGPLMHILRFYRPDKVILILSKEMYDSSRKDRRYELLQEFLPGHWDGYHPEWEEMQIQEDKVHNMDLLYDYFNKAINEIHRRYPVASLLFNLSSGTPQMQMILSQFVIDPSYHGVGIQVSSPENQSGTSDRTNKKDYDPALELECNEDETETSINRCFEPKMVPLRRSLIREEISSLLDRRDFKAVLLQKSLLSNQLVSLLLHLEARNELRFRAAENYTKGLDLPFSLYPLKGKQGKRDQILDYWMMMKNLLCGEHYSEFLLHLEPLVYNLQEECITKCKGDALTIDNEYDDIPKPAPYYEAKISDLNKLIQKHDLFPRCLKELSKAYLSIKTQRNHTAHRLELITSEEIALKSGFTPEELLKKARETIAWCYSIDVNHEIFSVYDKAVRYLKSNLS